ncbi:MAG: MFS transporter [Candidatus Hermodarchaeota archaeon]
MIFNPLITFLGAKTLPRPAHSLVQKFFILASLQSTFFMISGTFYVLYVIDKVDYDALGLLLAVSFIVQAILDYPSGVLGDWIGQRWTLTTAFVAYGLSYGLLALANSVTDLMVVYILVAFAASQESGAMQSWFDNNYKVVADEADPNRETYQLFQGKLQLILGYLWAATFIVGGLIATIYFRETVFALQSVGMFVLAGLCLVFVTNFPGILKPERSLTNYFKILGEGLRFTLSSKYMLFFTIFVCISGAVWSIWSQMILFPLYYGYTGSDLGAAFFRCIVWILAASSAAKAGEWSKKLNVYHWLSRMELFVLTGYFSLFALLIFIFPWENNLNLLAIGLVCLIFFFLDAGVNISNILRQRLMLDTIPDNIRNSIYSLFPTLVLIISAPAVFVAGNVIKLLEVPTMLVIMTLIGWIAIGFLFLSLRFLSKRASEEEQISRIVVTSKIEKEEKFS